MPYIMITNNHQPTTNNQINIQILLYLIFVLHWIIVSITVIGPFIFSNNRILCFIIVLNIFVVTQWYLYGYCFLTDIEKYLQPETPSLDNTNDNNGFITILVQKYIQVLDEKTVAQILGCVPFFSTTICCIKIIRNTNSNKIK